jgi:hypothetical protein
VASRVEMAATGLYDKVTKQHGVTMFLGWVVCSLRGEPKWRWFLQTVPAPPPNGGLANTLDEAKAAVAARYEQVKREK